eukprot:15430597-Alexandrium_andersonii.AAC.1
MMYKAAMQDWETHPTIGVALAEQGETNSTYSGPIMEQTDIDAYTAVLVASSPSGTHETNDDVAGHMEWVSTIVPDGIAAGYAHFLLNHSNDVTTQAANLRALRVLDFF